MVRRHPGKGHLTLGLVEADTDRPGGAHPPFLELEQEERHHREEEGKDEESSPGHPFHDARFTGK